MVFVSSRISQRLLGGHYLDRAPESITILRDCQHCGGDHGRPRFSGASLDYSVSHAGDWLVLAVVGRGLVGVDMEVLVRHSVADLAQGTLSQGELEQLQSDPDPRAHFVRLWTRKEAMVKLTGHGLAAELNRFDVTGPVAVTAGPPPGWPDGPIHLLDLPSVDGSCTAVATTTQVTTVTWCGPLLD